MKKVIVLGGTSAHIKLIEKLKNRKYYVYLLDYYNNPIAKQYADEFIQESTLDKDKVLFFALKLKVNLVISTSVDQANLTCCYVMEKLGFHVPYSYNKALEVTNKVLMKRKMYENGIPTARYFEINKKSIHLQHFTYPLIVKPADCNGSKGVRKINNRNQLMPLISEAIQYSRSNVAIVEEYKIGREIGVDCYIENKRAKIIMTRERRKIYKMENDVQQIYGSYWPASIDSKEYNDIQNIANKIAYVFELDNTPLMIQLIIEEDGSINVIEFAPRIGGGENARIIEMSTGFDIIEATIDSYLGIIPIVKYNQSKEIYMDNLIYAYPAVFGDIKFPKNKNIIFSSQLKTYGMEIGNNISSSNRVGSFIISAENENDALEKAKNIIDNTLVYDIDGNEIMRHDIY